MNEYEDAIWEASVYGIYEIEYAIEGVKQIAKWNAGSWNLFYDYTGDSGEQRRINLAVRMALTAEIEKRKAAGQKPDYTDREP